MPRLSHNPEAFRLKMALGKRKKPEVIVQEAGIDKKRVLSELEALSKERQKEVADFVSYLRIREELEATKEILEDEDFLEGIARGEEDFRQGRVKKWSEVKEDV